MGPMGPRRRMCPICPICPVGSGLPGNAIEGRSPQGDSVGLIEQLLQVVGDRIGVVAFFQDQRVFQSGGGIVDAWVDAAGVQARWGRVADLLHLLQEIGPAHPGQVEVHQQAVAV